MLCGTQQPLRTGGLCGIYWRLWVRLQVQSDDFGPEIDKSKVLLRQGALHLNAKSLQPCSRQRKAWAPDHKFTYTRTAMVRPKQALSPSSFYYAC